ncbi:NAD(P)H-dependent glycerol-3-phosphate dehydrogenase [Legionella micdadei]|uniref:Glycerol-3-phosphate dehydrogenase [NAD(P)+] n=1 Tax=Legionella micdadei TaxID=451 RepID=A0A098GIP2_LEGMI|nr:NAD(P)H-dependent glycerol-3-phosphate dehydrogenase [Legionella micdadei]ARG96769.1 glycerol-3-phosphate dehydrogenase [Legionella micdadei]ARG99502.1 glycerol-3-phosphate dehydrogenase [Legionella micdadei]KTD26438.1 glycerol-3-phosphate dehydrogenase (NAD+) [Legionella micdadei]NSL17970.1 NAD(P)-dependent glycerol-3-phosphate dehydrogenase [Legionella micdadei]CEG61845.1 Glycerol-3-phosphate dehydrogenase [NAD(P)+] [Legionella micdadei]
MKKGTVAILGAGSWGTAVAIHVAKNGNQVMLWGHTPQHVQDMIKQRCNQRYLPSCHFPDLLVPTMDLHYCLDHASEIIIAVPSHAFAELLSQLNQPRQGLAWLTKGVDPVSHKLLSNLVYERWGDDFPIAVISGPSFAREVAHSLPTALTLASNNAIYQNTIRALLHHNNLRVYLSNDVIGVQLCGAVKNVLAIACGISDGLGYGANAKAALITRGLAEMKRLGIKMGARDETFMGLAGLGDLVLTCTDDQSRNRRFGLFLGKGIRIVEAEQQIGQVVEGKHNASQICYLANQYDVEMPICSQVNALLLGKITPQQAVVNLMSRSPREE